MKQELVSENILDGLYLKNKNKNLESINGNEKQQIIKGIEDQFKLEQIHKEKIISKIEKGKTSIDYLKKIKIFQPSELKELLEDKNIKIQKENPKKIQVEGIPQINIKYSPNFPYPIPDTYKLYIFNKPSGFICDKKDPRKQLQRPTIYDFFQKILKFDEKLFCIGKLDFNATGLLLLTNSSELYHVIEKVANERFSYSYILKVHGRFTDEKLKQLRSQMIIKGKKIGPFICNVKRYLNRNTIIKITSKEPSMRDIKLSMQKLSLQISSINREEFGPYTFNGIKQGEMKEVEIDRLIRREFFEYRKQQLKKSQSEMDEKIELIKQKQISDIQLKEIKKEKMILDIVNFEEPQKFLDEQLIQ